MVLYRGWRSDGNPRRRFPFGLQLTHRPSRKTIDRLFNRLVVCSLYRLAIGSPSSTMWTLPQETWVIATAAYSIDITLAFQHDIRPTRLARQVLSVLGVSSDHDTLRSRTSSNGCWIRVNHSGLVKPMGKPITSRSKTRWILACQLPATECHHGSLPSADYWGLASGGQWKTPLGFLLYTLCTYIYL